MSWNVYRNGKSVERSAWTKRRGNMIARLSCEMSACRRALIMPPASQLQQVKLLGFAVQSCLIRCLAYILPLMCNICVTLKVYSLPETVASKAKNVLFSYICLLNITDAALCTF